MSLLDDQLVQEKDLEILALKAKIDTLEGIIYSKDKLIDDLRKELDFQTGGKYWAQYSTNYQNRSLSSLPVII